MNTGLPIGEEPVPEDFSQVAEATSKTLLTYPSGRGGAQRASPTAIA